MTHRDAATTIPADTTARAVRCAVWLGLLEAQRVGWTDVAEELFDLHARVVQRVRAAEYAEWRSDLELEGPHQGDRDDAA